MEMLLFMSLCSSVLLLCEGGEYWTTSWTSAYPVGPGLDLRGKMVTLSQGSGVTFFHPYHSLSAAEDKRVTLPPTTEWTTQWPTEWTTRSYPYYSTTPTPQKKSVSVCLRFMSDSSSFNLFKLAPRSPLFLDWSSSVCTLRWYYYSQVSLSPRVPLWNSVHTQPWTSLCLVLDSLKNVVQVFQGGAMSIRKILRSEMEWSGEPVLEMSGFDGQVSDLEVWDYPLQYREVLAYMQNYGSSGTVLTWSNVAYKYRGNIVVEEAYASRMKNPISSKRLKLRKKFNERKLTKNQML